MDNGRKQALERLITKELERIGWDPGQEPWADPARRGQQLFVDLGPGLGVFIQTFTREEIEEHLGNLEDELEERHPELGPEDRDVDYVVAYVSGKEDYEDWEYCEINAWPPEGEDLPELVWRCGFRTPF